ncbi:MAG: tRNA pseudouridine(54/55) synthase Pus10 [Candidatus Bathyarchaeia archaeon]
MEILEKAQKMLEKYPLCDHCLGRQFALLGYELDNQRRGEALKILLTMMGHELTFLEKKRGLFLLKTLAINGASEIAVGLLRKMGKRVGEKRECYLCGGRFKALPELVDKVTESLDGYEYTTFLIGIKLPIEVEEREDEFKAEFEIKYGESLRNDFSREIGKRVSAIVGREVNYKAPDMAVLVNPFTGEVMPQANPLYIAGRYRKLARGIPQSKWLCRECNGKGCPRCNWTGKMYPESVEEIIAAPILKEAGGEDASFHAAGREDIDARMLGHGRPFVLEVKKPKKRFIDLKALKETINIEAQGKVRVLNLRLTDKETVRKLKKQEAAEKAYKVVVEFDRDVSDEEMALLEKNFSGAVIRQQTPLRVLHRRSDRVREKHIYETKTKRLASNRIEMRIRCQGGLYIKELVTGDEGRTEPSVASLISAKVKPLELDVLGVIMEEDL